MTSPIVWAYDGDADARAVIAALRRTYAADVVTMTVDVGQSGDVRATRDLALDAGAIRAHVIDGVDEFVRRCVLPVLQAENPGWRPAVPGPGGGRAALAYPIIAAHLVDVAHLERTRTVAHGGGDALSAAIRAHDASLDVLTIDPAQLTGDRTPLRPVAPSSRHLLQRPVSAASQVRGVTATIEIEFADAIPVAINGVTLALPELIESLSLIGGEHGIGRAESTDAPGAVVLDAAYRALDCRTGSVRIELFDGRHRVVPAVAPELVNHA